MTATTANRTATALLPTGKRMNPTTPENAPFYDAACVAYVARGGVEGQDRTFVFTSHEHLADGFDVGTRHEFVHDQTGAKFGVFDIVAIHDFSTKTGQGEVPDKNMPHYVCK